MCVSPHRLGTSSARLDSEERPCPKCQGTATFEDMPEDYFRFLERIEESFP